LEAALTVIEERQERSALKQAAARMRQQVRDGVSFSNALKAGSKSFDELYCSLVAAGEASGALPQILKRQVQYLTAMDDLRSSVIQALLSPALIIGLGGLLMSFFMVKLVPNLMVLFSKTEQQVPLATRALIGMSNLFTQYWWLMIATIVLVAVAGRVVVQKPEGREWWDKQSHKLPLFGPVLECRFLAQFCQTLANLVGNGLPLLTGLTLMERATANTFLRKKVSAVGNIVADGGALSRAMRRIGGFPDLLIDLVGVGEQTGDLPAALSRASQRYEKEMRIRIQRITALVGPVVLIMIAGVIGLMVYAIITSIFQAISGIRAT
jgi:type II secretory pathway component PulF